MLETFIAFMFAPMHPPLLFLPRGVSSHLPVCYLKYSPLIPAPFVSVIVTLPLLPISHCNPLSYKIEWNTKKN